MTNLDKKKLVIIDGHSVTYRSFFAIQPLNTQDGTPTHAVLGFANTILKILGDEKPTHFMVTFDAGKKTFRSEMFEGYKATRSEVLPDLKIQFPLVEQLVESFGIKSWKQEGFESDDLVGTVTKWAEQASEDLDIYVVTGDRDLLQLVSDRTTVLFMKKGISEVVVYTPGTVMEQYGIEPAQLIDVKGLMGDKSDNIPGISGIGEKTALKLVSEYGSLENIFANLGDFKGKLKERLETGETDALLSKNLATIKRDVANDLTFEELEYDGYDASTLLSFFEKVEFKSLIKRLNLHTAKSSSSDNTHLQVNYVCIDRGNIGKLISSLSYVKAIHVEALGENPHTAEFLGIAFQTNSTTYFLPFQTMKEAKDSWPQVASWLSDPSKPKYVHDLNRTAVVLKRKRIILEGVTFDTLIAAYLHNPVHEDLSLNRLVDEYVLPPVLKDEEIYGTGAKEKIPDDVNVIARHAASKAQAVKALVPILSSHLQNLDLTNVFHDVEMKLARVLVQCETTGVPLDVEGLKQYGLEVKGRIDTLEKEIVELAGRGFAVGSPKQLATILFEDLGLPAYKKTKTGYSTDAEVLEFLRNKHPIVEKVIEHRMLSSLYTKFLDSLPNEIHKDGKIHTYYNMALTSTGRLSSQYPNMQNIPIRTEEGRKIRKYFIPSSGFDYILTADYSQIELRILAHLSRDPKMVAAFEQDIDIHTKTAMDVFGVAEDEVTHEMRRQAKAVNFGIVYGITEHGLANNLNISKKKAQEFIDRYFGVYTQVKDYMDSVVKKAKADGYVTTLLNRRRYIPTLTSSNYNVRTAAERMAMNTPIQGTAADIIKIAMIAIDEKLKAMKLKSRMLLQVHDELVFEVVESELETVQKLVRHEMENAVSLSVPLKVDIGYGRTWYDAK